jgi:hypothetical protein
MNEGPNNKYQIYSCISIINDIKLRARPVHKWGPFCQEIWGRCRFSRSFCPSPVTTIRTTGNGLWCTSNIGTASRHAPEFWDLRHFSLTTTMLILLKQPSPAPWPTTMIPLSHTIAAHQTTSYDLYYHPLCGLRCCWSHWDYFGKLLSTSPSHVYPPCICIATVQSHIRHQHAVVSHKLVINAVNRHRLIVFCLWVGNRLSFGAAGQ